jgi:hypothetical protein
MAFAGLGAAEVLRAHPDHAGAAVDLLADAATAVGRPDSDPSWSWPQPQLSYASAALAEVIIAAGHLQNDVALRAAGLRMLTWLRDVQLVDGRLSALPACGWRRGTPRQRYDQQPIEVAALADACVTAADATGDSRWHLGTWQALDSQTCFQRILSSTWRARWPASSTIVRCSSPACSSWCRRPRHHRVIGTLARVRDQLGPGQTVARHHGGA